MNLNHFKTLSKQEILSHTKIRKFETKIGECLPTITPGVDLNEAISHLNCKYVLIGVPEDIGVLANSGIAGTSTAWTTFLKAFVNLQSNDFFEGTEVAIAGYFDFGDMQFLIEKNAQNEEERLEAYRHAVTRIDDEVESIIKIIIAQNKIPIIVGGGQNNAYALLKGASKALHQLQKIPIPQINCMNLDAQADYRPAEGRHNGNAFRYAEDDGFLLKYCILGAQENLLPQNVWVDIVNNPFIDCITYEDIYVYNNRTFKQAVTHAIAFTEDNFTGIELDLTCADNNILSPTSGIGINLKDVRAYITGAASHTNVAYLHICEGAAQLADGSTFTSVGNLISTLVTDFIKSHKDAASL